MNGFEGIIPLAQQLPGFLLVLFRIGGIMIMAPLFGSVMIPAKVKIALALTLALALWPALPHRMMLPATLPAIIVGVGGELLLGLAIGLAINTVFAGVQLAGLTVSQQMGVALADVFNPGFDENADVVGVLYYWIGLVIFLAIGGHRLLIGSLMDSFKAIPLGGFSAGGEAVGMLTGMLTLSFLMAFKMAIPVVLALFLASVAMGLIGRTVPQLNILTAGFAIRTTLGVLVAAATLVAAMTVFVGAMEHALGSLNSLISGWVPAAGV